MQWDAVMRVLAALEAHAVDVSVATPATLYRMKIGTVRPLDHADAARLAEAFGLDKVTP